MKKFAFLFVGITLLASGSGCCWWGWPHSGYGYGGGYGGGYYGSPACPGGNCGIPGSPQPLQVPPSGYVPNTTAMQPIFPGAIPGPVTATLPPVLPPQPALGLVEPLPTY